MVEPDRVRFDFIHSDKISAENLRRIEDLVQEKILAGLESFAKADESENGQEHRRYRLI